MGPKRTPVKKNPVDLEANDDGAKSPAATAPVNYMEEFINMLRMQEKAREKERHEQEAARERERLADAKIRQEEKVHAEKLRKEDLERMEQERHAQQRAHEQQLEQMQLQMKEQLAALTMQKVGEPGTKGPSTKLPMFDLDKDKESFNIWQARWQKHVQGHRLDVIRCPKERNSRLMMELTAALSDFTMNWLLNMNLGEKDKDDPEIIIALIEDHIAATTNPLIQQVELGQISQHNHEFAEQLRQRIMEKANRCKFEQIKNYQDHQSMLALLRAVNPEIRKKMLLQKVDTFEKAFEILRNEEQAGQDSDKVAGTINEGQANAMSTYRRGQRSDRAQSSSRGRPRDRLDERTSRGDSKHRGRDNSGEGDPCFRCHDTEHSHRECPHYYNDCTYCHRRGHAESACRTKAAAEARGAANSVTAHGGWLN